MEYQGYLSKIEGHFGKSEYISIAQTSVKMLWRPAKKLDTELFCFVLNKGDLNSRLCNELAKYALSVTFYDKEKTGKTGIIVLSVGRGVSDKTAAFLTKKAQKLDGVAILPAAFDLNEQKLVYCENFPILFNKEFKTLSAFAEQKLKI